MVEQTLMGCLIYKILAIMFYSRLLALFVIVTVLFFSIKMIFFKINMFKCSQKFKRHTINSSLYVNWKEKYLIASTN